METAPKRAKANPPVEQNKRLIVGILRLDGAAYSAPHYEKDHVIGDAALAETFHRQGADVLYQRAEGYTFSACIAGLKDPLVLAEPVFDKPGEVCIPGPRTCATHLFIPNRRPGEKNAPRPRRPSKIEQWFDKDGTEGVKYIYDSATIVKHIKEALVELVAEGVACISGACGFMSDVQHLAASVVADASNCYVGVMMSSLSLLTLAKQAHAFSSDRCVLVLTANSVSFNMFYSRVILPEWGVPRDCIQLVGLQDVHGFGSEVAAGKTVDVRKAEKGIVEEVRKYKAHVENAGRKVAFILSECTELPGYTNALRHEFRLPVYDALSVCSMMLQAREPAVDRGLHATHG